MQDLETLVLVLESYKLPAQKTTFLLEDLTATQAAQVFAAIAPDVRAAILNSCSTIPGRFIDIVRALDDTAVDATLQKLDRSTSATVRIAMAQASGSRGE